MLIVVYLGNTFIIFLKKHHTTTDINITQNSVPAGNRWLFCFLLVHKTHPQTLLIETANDPCKEFKNDIQKTQRQREDPLSPWGSGPSSLRGRGRALFLLQDSGPSLLTDQKESSSSANRCEGWCGEFMIMPAILKHALKGVWFRSRDMVSWKQGNWGCGGLRLAIPSTCILGTLIATSCWKYNLKLCTL